MSWLSWNYDFYAIYDPPYHSAHTSIKMFGPQLVIPVTYMTLQSIQHIQPVPQSTCLVLNLWFLWHIWPFNPFSPYLNQHDLSWTCDLDAIYDPSIHSAHSARTSINMFCPELVIFVTYMTRQSIKSNGTSHHSETKSKLSLKSSCHVWRMKVLPV